VEPLVVVVKAVHAQIALRHLLDSHYLDSSRRIHRTADEVELPVTAPPCSLPVDFSVRRQQTVVARRYATPMEEVRVEAELFLSPRKVHMLPEKWEKIGDVLVLPSLPSIGHKQRIAQLYARALHCRTVLEDAGGITGPLRQPQVHHLYGSTDTETVHRENSIRYQLDPARIMFSSGNIDERLRMATVSNPQEVVVDLFAGIGYFTLPLAVHGGATVHACELNPLACRYLERNCVLNHVTDRVTVHRGDCRRVAPRGVAHRVVMGYFGSAEFMSTALAALQPEGGVIHYHCTCSAGEFPAHPLDEVEAAGRRESRQAELIAARKVKSYAPGVVHGVLDVRIS